MNVITGDNEKNTKKLTKLEEKIEDLTTASTQRPTQIQNSQVSKNHILTRPLLIIGWFFAVSYFFLKFGLTGIDFLGNFLVTVFSFLKVSMVWGIIDGEAWVSLMSAYTIFMIYFDLLLLFPLTYLLTMKKDPVERIGNQIRWETFVLVLILIPLLTTAGWYGVFGQDADERAHNVENFQVDTKSKWTQLVEGPLCPLINLNNPQVCLIQEQVVEAEKTKRVEYDIYFNSPDFTYVDNLERWKQKPFYLNYEILAKGEPVYLERIECYQNIISNETLLSNISLEGQEILSDDRTAIRGTQCNLDKATTDSMVQKDYKLITLLYYNFEATYTQPIPIYNMDLYVENKYGSKEGINMVSEEALIRTENKKDIKPIIPNDALSLSTYTAPSLPIFIGEDYQDRNQYTITFTFEKESGSNTLVSSEITDIRLPSNFEQNCEDYDCDSIIGPLSTYKDMSQIIIDFEVQDPNNERESYEDSIDFKIRSKFKKKNTITLTVNNPDYVEPVVETETEVVEGESTETGTEQTGTEQTESQETEVVIIPSAEENLAGTG